jgi:hypothetical protein
MANRHAPLDLHILKILDFLESASEKIPKIYSGKSAINAADVLLTKTKFLNSGCIDEMIANCPPPILISQLIIFSSSLTERSCS